MGKIIFAVVSLFVFSCENASVDETTDKQLIIATLTSETKYFCERNLEEWEKTWAHQPFCSKLYAGEIDFEELVGWPAIREFAHQHVADYPAPFPLPEFDVAYDIHLLGETAWVFFDKKIDGATMRETRFMVKETGKWKIARMQTIY